MVFFFNRQEPEQTARMKKIKQKIELDNSHDSKRIRKAKRLGKPELAIKDKKMMHGLAPILMGTKNIWALDET